MGFKIDLFLYLVKIIVADKLSTKIVIYDFPESLQPILQTNIYTQRLPIAVMILTLWLIRRNVPYELIPGFDRLSGLVMVTFALLGIMWVLDRTHIIAITFLPFQYVLLLFVVALVLIRVGIKKMMVNKQVEQSEKK